MLQLLVLMFFMPSCSSTDDEFYVENKEPDVEIKDPYEDIKEWFDVMCSPDTGGRYSGSDGINKAMNYIADIIGRSDSLEIDHFVTDKREMNNIIFHIKGETDSLIVLGAHYDAYGYVSNNPLPGADDNMSGVAVLLSVIKAIQKEKIAPHYSIDICLYDGEEIGRYGSKHYLSQCKYGIKKYINVDTCGNKEFGLVVLYDETNPSLKEEFERFILLVDNIGMKVGVYNPIGYTTDCEGFKSRHIPYVSIHNDKFSNTNHTMRDDVSLISFEKLANLAKGIEQYLRTY